MAVLSGQHNLGVSPSGKAKDFDSFIRKFESCYPCQKTTSFSGSLSFFYFLASLICKKGDVNAPMKKAVIGLFVKKCRNEADKEDERVYCGAIEENGGVALVLPPDLGNENIEHIVDECDGFFFSGGVDIEPSRYGAQRRAE